MNQYKTTIDASEVKVAETFGRLLQRVADESPMHEGIIRDYFDILEHKMDEQQARLDVANRKRKNYRLQLKQLTRAHTLMKRNYERLQAQIADDRPAGGIIEEEQSENILAQHVGACGV